MANSIGDGQAAYEQVDIEHGANVLSRQQNNEWCDIDLYGSGSKVDGNVVLPPIRAHKTILAAASEHCSRAFTTGFIESGSNELIIAEIDHDILQVVVDFIYTSKLRVVGPNVLERLKSVFIAADYLLMSELAGVCEKALVGPAYLNDNTCVAMWKFAEKYQCRDLEAEAAWLVADCVRFGRHQACYTNLPAAGLIWMVKSLASQSSVDTDSLCRVVVKWIEYDPYTRKVYGNEVMQHVPLQNATATTLRWLCGSTILPEDVVKPVKERLEQRLRGLLEKAAQSLTTLIGDVDMLRSLDMADDDQGCVPSDHISIEIGDDTAIVLVRGKKIEVYFH